MVNMLSAAETDLSLYDDDDLRSVLTWLSWKRVWNKPSTWWSVFVARTAVNLEFDLRDAIRAAEGN